jgi:hypothetical protein
LGFRNSVGSNTDDNTGHSSHHLIASIASDDDSNLYGEQESDDPAQDLGVIGDDVGIDDGVDADEGTTWGTDEENNASKSLYLFCNNSPLIPLHGVLAPLPLSSVPSRFPTPSIHDAATSPLPCSTSPPSHHPSPPTDLNAGPDECHNSNPEPFSELTALAQAQPKPRPLYSVTRPSESAAQPLMQSPGSLPPPQAGSANGSMSLTMSLTKSTSPKTSWPLPLPHTSPQVLNSQPSALPDQLQDQVQDQVVSTRGRRIRKANILSLNMCNCGVTITEPKIKAGTDVMRC